MKNINGDILVEHHVKYKEIHGVDETIMMSIGEHHKLHIKLRREGKCKIPVDELHTISSKAYHRTIKSKLKTKKYRIKNIQMWLFQDNMDKNIEHLERIGYNNLTGAICVSCLFKGNNGNKLHFIDIN